VVNDLDALVRGAAIGGHAAADGRVHARRANPARAPGSARSTRLAQSRICCGAPREARAGHGASMDWPGVVPILRLDTGAQHLRRRFRLRAAHWIILAVIVITGVAQSALARVLDPWIVTTLRVGFRLLSLALIVHVFAGVERMAGRSCRQACAAAFRRSDLCRDLRGRPATICGRMASRERKDHEAMGRLVLLGNARGRVRNARCNIRRA
jgi:hypothetical protein